MWLSQIFLFQFFRDAMSLNLKGTQNIIKLCRGMKHLEVGIPAKRRKLMQRKQQWQKKLKKCNSALCITIKLSELLFLLLL